MQQVTQPKLIFDSIGLKACNGELPKADIYLDCRSIIEPRLTKGGNKANDPWSDLPSLHQLARFTDQVIDTVNFRIPERRTGRIGGHYAQPVRVLCFCAWGMNRSVATKQALAKRIKEIYPSWDILIEGWHHDNKA